MREYRRVAYWAAVTLCGLILGGCANRQITAVTPCALQEQEIVRLQQALAEKDAEIDRLQVHRQARVRELEETTVQAARAEGRLRRFATAADVASRLAEVEVALEALQTRPGTMASHLQALARQLTDKASASFKQDEHSEAADRSAQARQLIEMLLANEAPPDREAAPEASFKIAIPLSTRVDTRLRSQPDSAAAVREILPAATPVMALGFHGKWLQVQTADRETGWISSDLVELQ